ncbi:NUDIX domain-containing protein [Seongchinamella sediminis]|uniref:NUDIX domain-containing protein n=1 Tax=Seongchinamella sediminis TaxID=2283635 RepID=A0A3L7DTK7_9GAMM|nr:CoA pyrophosphatase [Seongchinamella sediminis]RLQ20937.1 NUDIX domain-containing protein [Seongchinamella sediminis]
MQALQHHQHGAAMREQVRANLCAFQPRSQSDPALKHAAVVLAVTPFEQEAAIIVTRRASTLRAHTGQWALPGGRIDPGETPREAALREMHEEINLALGADRILGVLDDYVTRSGYIMTPVVVWNDTPWDQLQPNPDEVASISPFRFSELARDDSPRLTGTAQGDGQVLSMHFHDEVIFAPTGALLYQFREVAMGGRSTRVLHYDQPRFAWR